MQGPLGVVLKRCRRSEHGDHCIPDVFLHSAAGGVDLLPHRIVEALEQRSRAFGVLRSSERGRVDQIGEHDGRQLSLTLVRHHVCRRGARGAEACEFRDHGAARGARVHESQSDAVAPQGHLRFSGHPGSQENPTPADR